MSLSLDPKTNQKIEFPAPSAYLHYSPDLEQPAPDEAIIFDELSRTMQHITRTMANRYRHAYRPVHAKSHGLLVGKLEVLPGLPEYLAQGLFAQAATYPVIMRFSTNPGDLLADSVSTPRGLAVKVLGAPGVTLPHHAGNATQDFVCVNTDVFSAPDPAGFLAQIKTFDKTLETPEGLKHAVSVTARAINATIGVVGLHSATLEGVGAPAVHILGESFTTVAPLRYGKYVGKIGIAPSSESLKRLKDEAVNLDADYNALAELIYKFFRHETGVWDVRVQLALTPEPGVEAKENRFPVEDASKQWPADVSPWQTVGRITVVPQNSYSDKRQRFVDEQLSFTPWHALASHQPLGGIMRSRLKAYEEASKYRVERNGHPHVEPKAIDEVPA
jgi:catalase